MLISNQEFIRVLLDAGYPDPNGEAPEFPDVPAEYRRHFFVAFSNRAGISRSTAGKFGWIRWNVERPFMIG